MSWSKFGRWLCTSTARSASVEARQRYENSLSLFKLAHGVLIEDLVYCFTLVRDIDWSISIA